MGMVPQGPSASRISTHVRRTRTVFVARDRSMTGSDRERDYVRFDKVEKSYDGRTLVVEDLNLSVAKGEFVTMLGPSGSGKTTSLMMLAGFEHPTSGQIYLDGTLISRTP